MRFVRWLRCVLRFSDLLVSSICCVISLVCFGFILVVLFTGHTVSLVCLGWLFGGGGLLYLVFGCG